MNLVVTGGGSGGHISPALAVGLELSRRGHQVTYVGDEAGLEARMVPPSGLPFYGLPAGKLDRSSLRPGEFFKLLRGMAAARRLVHRLAPQAVLATGGYACFPFAYAAAGAGAPLVVHEQNAKLGLANRLLLGRALRLATATRLKLPVRFAERMVHTGLPICEARHDPREARVKLGLEADRPTLLVMGGSQGSLALNQALPTLLFPYLDNWQVLHQTGIRWLSSVQRQVGVHRRYHLVDFVDSALAFSAADIGVTRAGAMTLAEAAYHQVPLLLIPLPSAAANHQLLNARLMTEQGAARMLTQGEWSRFADELQPLLGSASRQAMRAVLSTMSPEGAAARLADLLLEVSA